MLGLAGCFVPPPLELEPDGAVPTSAPVIETNKAFPELGKTVTVRQTSPSATKQNEQQFVLKIWDPDSSTLYTRVFIDGDYTKLGPEMEKEHFGCNRIASEVDKGCPVDYVLEGLCDEMVNSVLGPHVLEIYVSDAVWADDNLKDLRKTPFGAFRDNVWWRFDCIEFE